MAAANVEFLYQLDSQFEHVIDQTSVASLVSRSDYQQLSFRKGSSIVWTVLCAVATISSAICHILSIHTSTVASTGAIAATQFSFVVSMSNEPFLDHVCKC